eukprot:RCo031449
MLSTTITRVVDGLPLAASTDDGSVTAAQKSQVKSVLKELSNSTNHPRLHTLDAGPHVYHILTQNGVFFLTLCEKSFPTNLAYSYLEEIVKEFDQQYGREVERVERPYAFIKFDTFIQKTKKVYMDSRNSRNLDRLKEDLHEVHQIFRSNIDEILARGDKLETMTEYGQKLVMESKKFKSKAVYMNRMAMLKLYAPLVVVALLLLAVVWWKLR